MCKDYFVITWITRDHIDLNNIILYHIDIKYKDNDNILHSLLLTIWSALNIMSMFMKELQGMLEFNEKLSN